MIRLPSLLPSFQIVSGTASGTHISDAVEKGATVVTGGEWEGNRCQPTLLTDVSEDMTVCRTETFGPVTSIYPVDSYEEGLEKANDTEYGLSSAIFTKDINKGHALCQKYRRRHVPHQRTDHS